MREIKFRAFEKTENLLIGVGTFYFTYKSILLDNGEEYCFDEVELMQYTGLKDKNGVEIYEGDLVKSHTGKIAEVRIEDCVLEWNIYFSRKERIFGIMLKGDADGCEVIGNIYENKELLNV